MKKQQIQCISISIVLLLLQALSSPLNKAVAQDIKYAKKVIDTLTSSTFQGRGYTADGMLKAAKYVASEFKSIGIQPLSNRDFFQQFNHSVNTFPDKMEIAINGKVLTPGKDYMVDPSSRGVKANNVHLIQADTSVFINKSNAVILTYTDKITWSPAPSVEPYTHIMLKEGVIEGFPKTININIDQHFEKNFTANNVIGYVKGKKYADSFMVITAHYDHLGNMGAATYFPGASDNASGTAMMLNFAKDIVAQPLDYSVLFIAFGSEELGLLGAKYFVDNPWIPLENINLLFNLDLMGNGDDGVTIVNATDHKPHYNQLVSINDKQQILKSVDERDNAPNSDHFPFTEKGVPALFIYTKGGNGAYHDLEDYNQNLPLSKYNEVYQLLHHFFRMLK